MVDVSPSVRPGVPQAAAESLAKPSIVLRAVAITAGLIALVALWPVAALGRYQEISRSTLGYQLRPEDPILVATGLLLVCLSFSFVLSFRPLREYSSIHETQLGFRKVIADSYFGQGHFASWTHTNPDAHLGDLQYPNDEDVVSTNDKLPAAKTKPESVAPVVNVVTEVPDVETVDYVVQRRDSWWKIAEERFDDPPRWEQLRSLNLGRQVAPTIMIEQETALRSGWVIQIPAE